MIPGFFFLHMQPFSGRVFSGKCAENQLRAKKNAPTRQRFKPFSAQQGTIFKIGLRIRDVQPTYIAHSDILGGFRERGFIVTMPDFLRFW